MKRQFWISFNKRDNNDSFLKLLNEFFLKHILRLTYSCENPRLILMDSANIIELTSCKHSIARRVIV